MGLNDGGVFCPYEMTLIAQNSHISAVTAGGERHGQNQEQCVRTSVRTRGTVRTSVRTRGTVGTSARTTRL